MKSKHYTTQQPCNRSGGYIALIALLVIAAAGLTIGIAVSLAGIDEIQMAHGDSQAVKALAVARTCAEDALERLRNNFSNIDQTLSINGNSCIISVSVIGATATLHATGTVDVYSQKIEATLDNNLNVVSWLEK